MSRKQSVFVFQRTVVSDKRPHDSKQEKRRREREEKRKRVRQKSEKEKDQISSLKHHGQ